MSDNPAPRSTPAAGADIFALLGDESPVRFAQIDLDIEFKDDLFELIGLAVKEAMWLRESFPVRLTAANPLLVGAQIGQGTVLDQYLLETTALIEKHFARIAERVATHVNEELS